MNRMQYRNFGTHESIVACHVTDITGQDRAGMRWYELRRKDDGPWQLHQQGTYSPDAQNRWMGAIAMDKFGNIALAYSVAGDQTYPSLRYTGRLWYDPLGEMTIEEQSIAQGAAANPSNRYGDYASLSLDPVNDSVFWFTGEYNPSTRWSTRIAAFTITDSCHTLQVSVQHRSQTSCPGIPDGFIRVSVQGGIEPYAYSLDGVSFQNDSVFNHLAAGEYRVWVSDRQGCQISHTKLEIKEPPAFTLSTQVVPVECRSESDGQIIVKAAGGSGDLRYSLDGYTFQSENTFTDLKMGDYTVVVQDDSGCIFQAESVHLPEPEIPRVGIHIRSPACPGTQDAEIRLEVRGNRGPYVYSLDGQNYQKVPALRI
ncbi:MAG: hypothetical protein HC880_11905 [Bacteroidia bacterium]|nr:hypothetical protein [Bacteroidia bacterium]